MTKFVRKVPKAAPEPESAPPPPPVIETTTDPEPSPLFSHGVDPEQARRSLASSLRYVKDDPTQPFCTCVSKSVGFGFDPSIGVYLHADPKCWRPSRAYYEASLQAGVLVPPLQEGTTA